MLWTILIVILILILLGGVGPTFYSGAPWRYGYGFGHGGIGIVGIILIIVIILLSERAAGALLRRSLMRMLTATAIRRHRLGDVEGRGDAGLGICRRAWAMRSSSGSSCTLSDGRAPRCSIDVRSRPMNHSRWPDA